MMPIDRLKPQGKNVKVHTQEQIAALAKIMSNPKIGFNQPIVIDRQNNIWAGHGRLEAAKKLGMKEVPTVYLGNLTEDEKKAYMIMENRINESPWNTQNLELTLSEIKFDFEPYHMAFDAVDPMKFGSNFGKAKELIEMQLDIEAMRRVKTGQIWQLGKHRVMCGDSTIPEHRDALLKTKEIDVLITDPPYSSGGFQEAGKHQGSIGTTRIDAKTGKEYTPKIKMDDLSTRGYVKLIRSMLFGLFFHNVYIFTDWRMWEWTREAIEASGYQVRGMIVWDKLTPGMGIQWRGQHELICFGRAKETVPPAWFRGNVINAKRSGNKYHPTEKPVAVLGELIKTNLKNATIYDPFAGSGSTLITAEQLGKICYAMEMDMDFCNIILGRWEKLTGKKAKLMSQ